LFVSSVVASVAGHPAHAITEPDLEHANRGCPLLVHVEFTRVGDVQEDDRCGVSVALAGSIGTISI
jgi:hypothetical protein